MKTIAFPHPPGAGGPGSFQLRFEKELRHEDWKIAYANETKNPDIVFIVGGTKKISWLWKMKRNGVPIVFRLDGINWLHKKKKVGLKHFIIAELSNWTIKFIHAFLADKIIYQSQFVKEWWDKESWRRRTNTSIIHNAVVIPKQSFVDNAILKRKTNRLVILEGVIDYTPYAIKLLNELAIKLPQHIEIEIYGKFENNQEYQNLNPRLHYKGFLKSDKVNDVLSGSVYLSLDINPACPNTVVEALASGAPVVAFDTGSLFELVDENSGKIIPYGSNPWNLGYPDVNSLIHAIAELFTDYDNYAKGAYQKAKGEHNISFMLNKYELIFAEIIDLKAKA